VPRWCRYTEIDFWSIRHVATNRYSFVMAQGNEVSRVEPPERVGNAQFVPKRDKLGPEAGMPTGTGQTGGRMGIFAAGREE
jgi:hypothetical protein